MTRHTTPLAIIATALAASLSVASAGQERVLSLRYRNGTSAPLWSAARDSAAAAQCAHTRAAMAQDVIRWLDANDDGCVDLAEMRVAFSRCLSLYERIALATGGLLGAIETPESTMRACERTGDARMCVDDLRMSQRECERPHDRAPAGHCLCDCRPIDRLYKFILSRQPC